MPLAFVSTYRDGLMVRTEEYLDPGEARAAVSAEPRAEPR